MRKIIHITFLTSLLIIILLGCTQSKEQEVSKKDYLTAWKKYAGDKYAIHMVIEKNPIPDEIDVIWNYQNYENFSSLNIHRSDNGGDSRTIDFLGIFKEENYPFYVVVSEKGIELQTKEVQDVKKFFEQFGGEVN